MGSLPAVEGFGRDYELPNRAYAETCAAIGGYLWSWRMLLASGDGRHADWMERALYNAILSGVSLDGRRYFYQNPLVSHGREERRPWYVVACCPPNIARVLGGLHRHVFTENDAGLQVHQWIGSTAVTTVGRSSVRVELRNRLPIEGSARLRVTVAPPSELSVSLRIPEWAEAVSCRVNGAVVAVNPGRTGYLELSRLWDDDTVDIVFGLTSCRVDAPAQVVENRGRAALRYGPLVYCVQGSDNPGIPVHDVRYCREGPEIRSISFRAPVLDVSVSGGARVAAVPYFAWCNDGRTDMAVWLRAAG